MASKLKEDLGIRVRAARTQAHLTQVQLAVSIGRSVTSVSNIERSRQIPSTETLADIARALQIPIAEFLVEPEDNLSLPPERKRLEAQLRELARSLSDRDLAITVVLAGAFLKQP